METTEEKKSSETKKCGCFCHKAPGAIVLAIGILMLLRALDVLASKPFWITISILVMVAGLKVMTRGACKCCTKS